MNKAEELRAKTRLADNTRATLKADTERKFIDATVDYAEFCILLLAERAASIGEKETSFSMSVRSEVPDLQREAEYLVLKRLAARGFLVSVGALRNTTMIDIEVGW